MPLTQQKKIVLSLDMRLIRVHMTAIVTMDVILVMEQSGNIQPLRNQNVEVPPFMRIQMILRAMKVAVLNMI